MRNDNSTLLKKLKQYSILAAPLIATAGLADAQVIYKDINPDKVLDANTSNGESFNLDLNNDGKTDFVLRHRAIGNNQSARFNEAIPQYDLDGSIKTNSGAVGGYLFTGLTTIITGTTVAIGFPYALSAGQIICDDIPFFGLSTLLFTYNGNPGYIFPPVMNAYYTTTGGTNGYWVDAFDMYLPLRVTDQSGNNYYGWARCETPFDGTVMIVKDVAYEATAGKCIPAGDMVGIDSPEDLKGVVIFSFNRVLSVNFDAKYNEASVHVINVMGQELVNQNISAASNQIDLSQLASGNYVVMVKHDGKVATQKINLH